jgi:hypothetical protein
MRGYGAAVGISTSLMQRDDSSISAIFIEYINETFYLRAFPYQIEMPGFSQIVRLRAPPDIRQQCNAALGRRTRNAWNFPSLSFGCPEVYLFLSYRSISTTPSGRPGSTALDKSMHLQDQDQIGI